MKIRKFNESLDVDLVDIDNVKQEIISMNEISDYFSLVEHYGRVSIELGILSISDESNRNIETRISCSDDQVCYNIVIRIYGDDSAFCFPSDDSDNECYDTYDDTKKISSVINDLNSINNKLKAYDHSLYLSVSGFCIKCVVLNNKNNK